MRPEVLEAMLPYLEGDYGNPSSIHRQGRTAERAVDDAREQAAALIGASPKEIILTSGGTESNNMAVLGARGEPGRNGFVTTSIEHDAVLEPCARLRDRGFETSTVGPGDDGIVRAAEMAKAVGPGTSHASVMTANNEVGTIQPISEIAGICRERGAVFHTDAVQAAGKVPLDVSELGVDMLSFSSHKINGPKGAGALYVRKGVELDPLILGGGQERGMRSGTENVAAIAGFGRACEMARERLTEDAARVRRMRDRLAERILGEITHVEYNGSKESRLPGNAHFTFYGVSGEDLLIKLDEYGLAASTGSACSVRTQKESHVLRAMGFARERINGSLRLSVGIFNTDEEIDGAVDALTRAVAELRRVSPYRAKYGF
ncbi:cysteine sulfinate desulfinase/cysteine desulfurase [Cenarchaeum symbiosum A]|uniref:cysteine desulfurase n=1 Tax=Cenarchaeum symbiosum (strain A) TaxID=414004 RepID=A0RXX5_CENSY|nr:cysteine sulfinate desulfinase/cysteine desulfurase [Cenarchaeum symbiosum A]